MNKTKLFTMSLLALTVASPALAKKETARDVMDRYFAVIDAKQLDRLAEVETANVEMVTPMGTLHSSDGHKQMAQGFATAFPNFKHVLGKCIESGESISCEGHFVGDHTGPMQMPNGQTVPATHKHIDFSWAGLATVKGGKVTSMHVYFDTMVMMQQLGLVPPPAHAALK